MTLIGCGYAMDLPPMMAFLPWCNHKRTASFFPSEPVSHDDYILNGKFANKWYKLLDYFS